MIITGVRISKLRLSYAQPFRIAIGEMTGSDNVVLTIETDTGLLGWGEASPCPPITGDSQAGAIAAAHDVAALMIGKDPVATDARMAEFDRLTAGNPSIRAAFDMAMYDLAARAANMPLYRFLGGEQRPLHTDQTIPIQPDVAATRTKAREILAAGFEVIKVKVGRPGLIDVDHVLAVRALVGPAVGIRIDGNQGWDLPTAVANIRAMEGANIDYVEQPLPAWDLNSLSRLRRMVNVPICLDESVFDDKDALKAIHADAADYINIKLGKSGGIHTALRIEAVAAAAGKRCMIGCFGESRLALTAAAHLAMARPNIAFYDLDSAYQFTDDPVIGGLVYDTSEAGRIRLGEAPGLGARIDEAALEPCV